MAEVGLLPFARIALQVSRAVLPRYRSRFSKHQFTQPQLLAILCLMRYEDWTFREAEVRLGRASRIAPGVGACECARLHDAVPFLAASGRPDHRPRGRRNGAPVARYAAQRTAAGSRGRGRHGLGAGSGEHVLCAAHASSRAKTAAVAALAEVGGRGGFGSAVRVVADSRGAARGTTARICLRSSKRLPSKRASDWCWPTPSSTARGITPISASNSEHRASSPPSAERKPGACTECAPRCGGHFRNASTAAAP